MTWLISVAIMFLGRELMGTTDEVDEADQKLARTRELLEELGGMW